MDRHSLVDLVRALARTNDPQTSKDAAEKMVKSGELNRQEEMVYKTIKYYIETYKHNDFTTKDIAIWIMSMSYHKAYDICRKRFSGLERKGKIELVTERKDITDCTFTFIYKRRDGCRVWKLK
jgi:hypothetical protein